SLLFRGPSQHPRTVPRTRRLAVGRCFLSWAFLPFDTYRGGGPVPAERPAPRRAASEVSTSLAAFTTVPPAPCGAERPWASPSKAFSSKRSGPLAKPPAFVAFAASIRLAPLG